MSKRIMYLRDNNNPQGKGNPIACLAIEIIDVPDGTKENNRSHSMIQYQIAVCHPKDQFDRQAGQFKANIKLQGKPIFVGTLDEDCVSIHQVSSMIMYNIINDKTIPKRVRQSAQRWLDNAANLSIKSEQLSLFSLTALRTAYRSQRPSTNGN